MALKVENILTKVLKVDVEENEISYAVKADVTNIRDDEYSDEDVTIEIQGLDSDCFEILSIYLSGRVPFNSTKTITDREDYQNKDEFDQVVLWQYAN